ncbi:MAG: glyoxylate/hydroxypyruvate reductase A [Mesorhizobium sp.]|nr:MAG: glyoxylate/hydroxypyruvate reductase A [Mesorhizobium sp.]
MYVEQSVWEVVVKALTLLMVNDYPDYIDAGEWARSLKARVSGLDFRLWPHHGDPGDIDLVLIDKGTPRGFFEGMTRLRAVAYLGAGIDGLQLGELPAGVGVVRLATRELASEVVQYIVLRVLCRQRHVVEYAVQQTQKIWRPIAPRKISETGIVILGAGRIGGWAARLFAELGYRSAAWSRNPKQIADVACYAGAPALKEALAERDFVVCALPLTTETRGILNSETFRLMKRGAYLVNVGRGAHVDEAALLHAIDAGQLSGACLDVFTSEPLDQASPLWAHPKVTITPHVASYWVDSGIAQVAGLCEQIKLGNDITNLVNLERGY